MDLAELLGHEAVEDGEQLLAWARARAATLVETLESDDPLAGLLAAGARPSELDDELEGVPVTRRRRREPSSPQPKTADELPPPPEHPGLAEGEPEPMLETVDTGPIDLEEELVRRRMREDSWALASSPRELERAVERAESLPLREREPEPEPVVEHVAAGEPEPVPEIAEAGAAEPAMSEPRADAGAEPESLVEAGGEPSIEIDVASEPSIEIDVDLDLAPSSSDEAPAEITSVEPSGEPAPEVTALAAAPAPEPEAAQPRELEPSAPELPVVVGPAGPSEIDLVEPAGLDLAAIELPDSSAAAGEDDEEFEVDDLDELEVEEVELDDEDEPDDEPVKPSAGPPTKAPPKPPPPKGPPPPRKGPPPRDETADLVSALVRSSESKSAKLDELDGAPDKPDSEPT